MNRIIFFNCFVFLCMLIIPLAGLPGGLSAATSQDNGLLTEAQLQNQLQEYLGIPYRWGGKSSRGMDCSGFVNHIYTHLLGIELPHNAALQYRLDILEKIPSQDLKPGDLIFFSSNRRRIDHVGIYYSEGQFIHASRSRGISFSSLDDNYWKRRLVAAKRLTFRDDVLVPDHAFDDQFENQFENWAGVSLILTRRNWMTLQASSRFRSALPSAENRFGGALTAYPPAAFSQTLGAGWTHLGQDAAWALRVSAFNQFNRSHYHQEKSLAAALRLGGEPDYALADQAGFEDSETRWGLKLALNLNPRYWLSVTPSFTYYHHPDTPEVPTLSGILGLGAHLEAPPGKWSLTMKMQYLIPENMPLGTGHLETTNKMLDLGLALGYQARPSLRFAFTTEHALGPDYKREWFSQRTSPAQHDYRLMMDWHF